MRKQPHVKDNLNEQPNVPHLQIRAASLQHIVSIAKEIEGSLKKPPIKQLYMVTWTIHNKRGIKIMF